MLETFSLEMYHHKLSFAFLLLVIAAELLEAKSTFHNRDVQNDPTRRQFQLSKRQTMTFDNDYFLCAVQNRPIPVEYVCDGYKDCNDGSDEPEDCLTRECPEGYVKCSDGQCIKNDGICNGYSQCWNRSAVVITAFKCPRAECEPYYSACSNITKCIARSFVCDTDNDCYLNSDEMNCDERVCEEDEFRCNNGQCISKSVYCTASWTSSPCRDGTDVTGICLDFTCPEDAFRCQSDGRCYSNSARCDGYANCADASDESETVCPPVQCDPGYTRCPTRNKCIKSEYFCDTDNDCADDSDESPELCANRTCEENELRCASGQCLKKELFCRAEVPVYRCRDDSLSSFDFSTCPPRQCDSGYERCPTSNRCLKRFEFCDAFNDCGDNSDEASELCENRVCQENEIACANGQCIVVEEFCKEWRECEDGSRSPNNITLCNNRVCEENEVRCANGQCINTASFCNGVSTCQDGSLSKAGIPACGNFTQPHVRQHAMRICLYGVGTACGAEPAVLKQFARLDSSKVFAKLAMMDLSNEICSPVQKWGDCALETYESNEQCRVAEQLNPDMRPLQEFALRALDYVCKQNVEVINREKACLLKLSYKRYQHPIVALKFLTSCASHIVDHFQRQSQSHEIEPFCISSELQQCAKNVIAEECGDDIAKVANGLADMVQELCKELLPPAKQPPALTSLKRHAKDIALLKKMLGSVF